MGIRVAALAAVAAVLTAPPASATVDLTAIEIRVGDHPSFVRVIVEFTDGILNVGEVVALDPLPDDGVARLEIPQTRVRTEAPDVRAEGVRVHIAQGTNRIIVRVDAARRRFKYVDYFVLRSPERLVVDLWKSAPPVAAESRRRLPGCPTFTRHSVGERVSVSGRVGQLFEATFLVRLRRADGRMVVQRIMTRPPGRWSLEFGYRVARRQAGTLEAVVLSAKDGALDCLTQVRVALVP